MLISEIEPAILFTAVSKRVSIFGSRLFRLQNSKLLHLGPKISISIIFVGFYAGVLGVKADINSYTLLGLCIDSS